MTRRSTAAPRVSMTAFWRDRSGSVAIEYGVLITMIITVLVGILLTSGSIAGLWERIVGFVVGALSG